MDPNLHKELGEIKGLLEGVYRLVQNQHEATNQRITDLHVAVTRRLDSHDTEISGVRDKAQTALDTAKAAHARLDEQKAKTRNAAIGTGAGAGAVIAAGVEIAKAMLKGG
jgi:ElaB/YqjD/DUF883 family membrane-anchored ribosome-binding protein